MSLSSCTQFILSMICAISLSKVTRNMYIYFHYLNAVKKTTFLSKQHVHGMKYYNAKTEEAVTEL